MSGPCNHVLGMTSDYDSTPFRANDVAGFLQLSARKECLPGENLHEWNQRLKRTPLENLDDNLLLIFTYCPDCGAKLPPLRELLP